MKRYLVRDNLGRILADFKAKNLSHAVLIEMYEGKTGKEIIVATSLVHFRRLDDSLKSYYSFEPEYRITAVNKHGETIGIFNRKHAGFVTMKFPKPIKWYQFWRRG